MSSHEVEVTTPDRRGRGPAPDTRERAMAGALACLREAGRQGTTIAAVSRASGLSRPTIYAHFNTLDELIHQVVEAEAVALSGRIGREVAKVPTAGGRVVEFVVVAHREFRADPVVAMIADVRLTPEVTERGAISADMLRLAKAPLRATLADDPAALARIDEIAETTLRFLLSVLTYRSANTRTDARLRSYAERALLPALGLR